MTVKSERGINLVKRLEDKKIEVENVESSLLQSLKSETETPQGILAVLNDFPTPNSPFSKLYPYPDEIRDPGNLGTLLRTAAAAGVQAVLRCSLKRRMFSRPKVVRSGMGAHFRLPLHSITWDNIRAYTKGLQIYLADMEGGQSCWERTSVSHGIDHWR